MVISVEGYIVPSLAKGVRQVDDTWEYSYDLEKWFPCDVWKTGKNEYALALLQAHLEDIEDALLDSHLDPSVEHMLTELGEHTMDFMRLYRPEGSPHYEE